jgi:hypothetical protein
MSYENTSCPCGGIKERQTMICDACRDDQAGSYDLAAMDNQALSMESRRISAIKVLASSRRRIKRLPFAFTF